MTDSVLLVLGPSGSADGGSPWESQAVMTADLTDCPEKPLNHLLQKVSLEPVYNDCFSQIISSFP